MSLELAVLLSLMNGVAVAVTLALIGESRKTATLAGLYVVAVPWVVSLTIIGLVTLLA